MFPGYEHKEITYSCVVPNSNIFTKYKISCSLLMLPKLQNLWMLQIHPF